jgi:proteic killer suppression protein
MAIQGFRGKLTGAVREGKGPKGFPAGIARRKLAAVEAAVVLDDLKAPPGNELEASKRDRRGQHSIRINDQWRVCFIWTETGPKDVEIVDCHKG